MLPKFIQAIFITVSLSWIAAGQPTRLMPSSTVVAQSQQPILQITLRLPIARQSAQSPQP